MSTQPLTYDLENQDGTYEKQPKAIFAGDFYEGQPAIAVTEDEIVLAGDSNTVVRVDPEFGVLISGDKVSFSATPDQISIGGGYWRFNPLLLTCLPSTTPTPIPTLVKATPNLLEGADSLSGCLSFLTSNSDAA
jgi:hypothetical protein